MMTEAQLEKLLRVSGWGALSGYAVWALFAAYQRELVAQYYNIAGDSVMFTMTPFLIGTVLEAPLQLAFAMMCLFAAAYLRRDRVTIPEIFE